MTAVGSNSEARKRRQESEPADETVRVPAALLEALRLHLEQRPHGYEGFADAARALVDAAERPDEGRCTCGESVPTVTTPGPCYWAENAPGAESQVHCPPTTPVSSPRRTRDEGTEDEAEITAAEVWHQWVLDEEPALPPEWWDITRRAVAAGFRAARLAGEDDQ